MKKVFALISTLIFLLGIAGCDYQNLAPNDEKIGLSTKYEILTEIIVRNGDREFDGVLYDNETTRAFVGQLPLTAELWDPAAGFAKAINLNEALVSSDDVTREYELGGMAYWPDGLSVAFFYDDIMSQTVVPVITIGKLNSVSGFSSCSGLITIEEKTDMPEESEASSLSVSAENNTEIPLESSTEAGSETATNDSVTEAETSVGNTAASDTESTAEFVSDTAEAPIPSDTNSSETVVAGGDTLLTAAADPKNSQTLYIWEKDNMPSVTEYTENYGGYADDPDFRPYIVTFPVPEGTPVKGAVLINAGGAFQYRSDQNEGTPVAQELSRLGYQSFVVNYRLRPYTQQESALDLARAVRFVRKNAEIYGIDEKDIAVMGFSAGGILAGEMLLNFDGTVNGTALDSDYKPDMLDDISADASACGMIYSFYGRLSFASDDVEKFRASDLPPTYFCYGTRDPFVSQFEKCIAALREAGIPTTDNVLQGSPHGYGYTQGWIPAYDEWLESVFEGN